MDIIIYHATPNFQKAYGPYTENGKEGKVRTARKGWRGKSLLKQGKDSEVRIARKGWRGKEGKDSDVRTARKG